MFSATEWEDFLLFFCYPYLYNMILSSPWPFSYCKCWSDRLALLSDRFALLPDTWNFKASTIFIRDGKILRPRSKFVSRTDTMLTLYWSHSYIIIIWIWEMSILVLFALCRCRLQSLIECWSKCFTLIWRKKSWSSYVHLSISMCTVAVAYLMSSQLLKSISVSDPHYN